MSTPVSPYAIPSTLDTVALNTSLANYSKTLLDNVYNSFTFLNLLNSEAKSLIDGGLSIVEPLLEVEQDAGGFYQGADILNCTQSNSLTQVEFRYQDVHEPIQINRDEERQNSGMAHKILDLVATKTVLSEKAMGKRLEQALSTSVSGSGNLNSLEDIVGTGTLGSINGAVDTFWQSQVTTSGSFAVQGLSDMTTAYYAVSSGQVIDNPTHIITNQTIFRKFENTRLPIERISNGATANAGFENLTFKGKPVIYGAYIGSGLMMGININYLKFVVDSMTDMITTPFIQPSNQMTKVAHILWSGNLITNNRRRHFKLTSIT